jgi:hypothetical protein
MWTGTGSTGWVRRLGPSGEFIWDKYGEGYLGEDAIVLSDQSLVLVAADERSLSAESIDADGIVQHRRTVDCKSVCGYFNLFRNLKTAPDFFVEILAGKDASILHLASDLKDIAPPMACRHGLWGRGFRSPAGNLLIFGAGHYAATISAIDSRGKEKEIHAFEPLWDSRHVQIAEESINFDDVAAVTDTKFVTARSWVAPLAHGGVYIDWLRID